MGDQYKADWQAVTNSHHRVSYPNCEIHMRVSANGGTPKSSILIGFSICKPSILGYPHLWKPPYSQRYILIVNDHNYHNLVFPIEGPHWPTLSQKHICCFVSTQGNPKTQCILSLISLVASGQESGYSLIFRHIKTSPKSPENIPPSVTGSLHSLQRS